MTEIKLPPLPKPDAEFRTTSRAQIRAYAKQTAEPYRKALHDLILDLEMRSNLKRGDDKGVLDCGNGVYRQALMALGEMEIKSVKFLGRVKESKEND